MAAALSRLRARVRGCGSSMQPLPEPPDDDGNMAPVLIKDVDALSNKVIGSGSFGVVYRAFDLNMQTEVVLKALGRGAAGSSESDVQSFLRRRTLWPV